jgi:hypothetical protein
LKAATTPGSGGHLEVSTTPGSGCHLEVSTTPGSGGHLEVPTTPESGGHLEELDLELIQTQMAPTPVLRDEVYARALRARKNVKRAEVWVSARLGHDWSGLSRIFKVGWTLLLLRVFQSAGRIHENEELFLVYNWCCTLFMSSEILAHCKPVTSAVNASTTPGSGGHLEVPTTPGSESHLEDSTTTGPEATWRTRQRLARKVAGFQSRHSRR